MGKNKKRKKVIYKKQTANTKREINPFEIRINKQKYDVLGRKSKNDHGMPGISRSKALKKRKETLLNEFKTKNKSNYYTDRRFGESNADLNPDDKAALRFAAERKKTKSMMYNLNDEEELTHLGRSIGDMDKFDVPSSESEDEERLEGDVVKKAHFGGFLTKKDSEESEKSHKAIMEEIIADRLKRKQERQREKENNLDLTEKLDVEWKDMRKLMAGFKQTTIVDQNARDDYDIKVQELKFEAKGRAMDKLKTPEEIAFDEKQKLERLEMERIERMNANVEGEYAKRNRMHISADGLDDDYDTSVECNNPNWTPHRQQSIDHSNEGDEKESSGDEKESSGDEKESSGDEKESSGDEKESSGDEKESSDDEKESSDDEKESSDDEKESSDDEKDNSGDEKEDSGDESEDSYADVLSDNETSDSQEITEIVKIKPLNNRKLKGKIDSVPFILQCPASFQDFFELVSEREALEINVIVDRIIKCNHPSLGSENKDKMENFFTMILQYIEEVSSLENSDFTLLDCLIVHVKTLLDFNPRSTSKLLMDVITEKREEFLSQTKGAKKPFPDFSTLIFLKLVSILYPPSDFHHPIVTPAAVFMSEILTTCKVDTFSDLVRGLFICSLFYEFVATSKRFVPEVINFLNHILTFTSNCGVETTTSLIVNSKLPESMTNFKLSVKLIRPMDNTKGDKMVGQLIYAVISLLEKFSLLYQNVPSFFEIFHPTKSTLSSLQTSNFNSTLVSKIDSLQSVLSSPHAKSFLVKENRRPQGLKLFEPKIQENFTGKKQYQGSKKKLEQQKLLHKYKREMKGAMREVRRDNQFIASTKLNEQLAKDSERKQKLKRLYQDLASQEGEFKKYKNRK